MISTPKLHVSDKLFWEICQQNPELRLERTATGELILTPLTGGETGSYNADLTIDFGIWNRRAKLGKVFDDSLGDVQEKMREYMANGVQSGWLINRADKTVEIYRQGQPVQVVSILYTFSGEDVLPRFELEV